MARKRRTSHTKRSRSIYEQLRETVVRPEVLGIGLIMLSAFTLLSIVTRSRGVVTAFWIDTLVDLFGLGKWGFPIVTGALGLWMVIRAIERMPDLPWQRPAGFLSLFVAFITGATLLRDTGPDEAGGWVGAQIASVLIGSVSLSGAWAIVAFLVVVGLFLLTDRILLDLARDGAQVTGEWVAALMERRALPSTQPALPISQHQLPWWQRIRARFAPAPVSDPVEPPQLVRPVSPRPQTQAPQRIEPVPDTTPARGPANAPKREILTPNIIGGDKAGHVGRLPKKKPAWELPRLDDILLSWDRVVESNDHIRRQGKLIQETLALFGVPADFEGANKGPSVTRYMIRPGYIERTVGGEKKRIKVKVAKIASLSNDLALALAAPSVRIEAPVPGTNYVGVEVPNTESNVVGLKELMESDAFVNVSGKLKVALGEDIMGAPVVADLARMPHLLIAGATGSGKSACINSMIASLLLTHTPDTLHMLMIDPKMVELSVYNHIPHLRAEVVTEVDKAAAALFWAVNEMERRYQLLNKAGARDLERYNAHLVQNKEEPLPYIVVIVDEMADLMMAAPEEVEKYICRLAQMARAVGIHLIIATQRPSVDVITGLIKANFPSRIAFAVSSQVDSRVVLDTTGAERLLGRGDMLYIASDASRPRRLQGTWIGDEEITKLVQYWKKFQNNDVPYEQPSLFQEVEELKERENRDELFDEAVSIVRGAGRGSASLLQSRLSIGYNRASRLINQLEEAGIVGPDLGGNQGREVLATGDEPEPDRPVQDTLFDHAVHVVRTAGQGSTSLLQRELGIDYDRALQLMDQLEKEGILQSEQSTETAGKLPRQQMNRTSDHIQDEFFDEAVLAVFDAGRGTVNLLQRRLRISTERANRLLELLEQEGILGPDQGGNLGRPLRRGANRQAETDAPPPHIVGGTSDKESRPPRIWM